MTRNSRLNSLTGTKNKRLLFKVVKTNWTHNNRPFLDTSDFPHTVLLDVSGFPASANRNVIATAITNWFASLKVMAVRFVGNVARVSFADPAAKQLILRNESIVIGDIPCRVRGGGPRPQKSSCTIFHLRQKMSR